MNSDKAGRSYPQVFQDLIDQRYTGIDIREFGFDRKNVGPAQSITFRIRADQVYHACRVNIRLFDKFDGAAMSTHIDPLNTDGSHVNA